MKVLLTAILFTCKVYTFAQQGYPVPPADEKRLFYIQHSENHNTFVYNSNLKNGSLVIDEPVEVFKIAYTDGGEKVALNPLQKSLAFGIKSKQLSTNLYELELAASKKVKFYLILDKLARPRVYTTINARKIYVDHIFLKLKEGTAGLGINLEYAVFFGEDYSNGKDVSEKLTEW